MRTRRLLPLMNGVRALACLCIGMVCGSMLADPAARTWVFEKATLFKAMQRVHTLTSADFVFVDRDIREMSFQEVANDPDKATAAVAKQYNREMVSVARVYVLRESLPDAKTPQERRSALAKYMDENFPTSPNGYLTSHSKHLFDRMISGNKQLHRELPMGESRFDQLTPNQQQQLLEALRYAEIGGSLQTLDDVVRPLR